MDNIVTSNPFRTKSNPVYGDQFFGHKQNLVLLNRYIDSNLKSAPLNICFEGSRTTGKSSFLKHTQQICKEKNIFSIYITFDRLSHPCKILYDILNEYFSSLESLADDIEEYHNVEIMSNFDEKLTVEEWLEKAETESKDKKDLFKSNVRQYLSSFELETSSQMEGDSYLFSFASSYYKYIEDSNRDDGTIVSKFIRDLNTVLFPLIKEHAPFIEKVAILIDDFHNMVGLNEEENSINNEELFNTLITPLSNFLNQLRNNMAEFHKNHFFIIGTYPQLNKLPKITDAIEPLKGFYSRLGFETLDVNTLESKDAVKQVFNGCSKLCESDNNIWYKYFILGPKIYDQFFKDNDGFNFKSKENDIIELSDDEFSIYKLLKITDSQELVVTRDLLNNAVSALIKLRDTTSEIIKKIDYESNRRPYLIKLFGYHLFQKLMYDESHQPINSLLFFERLNTLFPKKSLNKASSKEWMQIYKNICNEMGEESISTKLQLYTIKEKYLLWIIMQNKNFNAEDIHIYYKSLANMVGASNLYTQAVKNICKDIDSEKVKPILAKTAHLMSPLATLSAFRHVISKDQSTLLSEKIKETIKSSFIINTEIDSIFQKIDIRDLLPFADNLFFDLVYESSDHIYHAIEKFTEDKILIYDEYSEQSKYNFDKFFAPFEFGLLNFYLGINDFQSKTRIPSTGNSQKLSTIVFNLAISMSGVKGFFQFDSSKEAQDNIAFISGLKVKDLNNLNADFFSMVLKYKSSDNSNPNKTKGIFKLLKFEDCKDTCIWIEDEKLYEIFYDMLSKILNFYHKNHSLGELHFQNQNNDFVELPHLSQSDILDQIWELEDTQSTSIFLSRLFDYETLYREKKYKASIKALESFIEAETFNELSNISNGIHISICTQNKELIKQYFNKHIAIFNKKIPFSKEGLYHYNHHCIKFVVGEINNVEFSKHLNDIRNNCEYYNWDNIAIIQKWNGYQFEENDIYNHIDTQGDEEEMKQNRIDTIKDFLDDAIQSLKK